MMFRNFIQIKIVFLLSIMINTACHNVSSSNQAVENFKNENLNKNTVSNTAANSKEELNPLLKSQLGGVPNGEAAWTDFTKDGKYRIAKETDFNLSASVLSEDHNYLRYQNKNPFMHGDINKDALSHDCAVIVVDTESTAANKFGVVIFNQESDSNSVPIPNWLYRNKDLSTSVFGWSRDGLSIMTYNEKGDYELCLVTWNKAKEQYICK